ncbi:MAG: Rid family detoxifying hydrolase [Patescibacteria group bacterium]|nr:Rid family detoxifying hydrolase [Patescibacteria group bacterium]
MIVFTNKAPLPIGPYSQAVITDNLIFCSGQIGINPKTGQLEKGIANQTRQVLENLKNILQEAGSDLERVIKITIFLSSLRFFHQVNEICEEYFNDHPPARTTIEVNNLPQGALIEI